jgi:predicted lipid-binding transport protein (Tim44 family)
MLPLPKIEHAFFGQRRQRLAQREQRRRRPVGRPGQRQHRHVGVGEHVAQRRPDAVVQAAFGDHVGRDAGGACSKSAHTRAPAPGAPGAS